MFKNNFYLFLLLLFLSLTFSLQAEIGTKSWTKICNEKNKTNCLIGIKKNVEIKGNDKAQTLSTAYVQLGKSKERKMDLVDKTNQTYKLNENEINLPIFFINLPLNTDLRKKPLMQVDGKNIFNLDYLSCNATEGCKALTVMNEQSVELFKKGKELTVIFGVPGQSNNVKVDFTLKGFSNAYENL